MILVAAPSRRSVDYLAGILCGAGYTVRVTPSAYIATHFSSGLQLVILVSSSCSSRLEKICSMCSQIRTSAPKIPIVVVGPDDTDAKVRLFDLEADDYIVEPFDHLELFARVKSLIGRRQF